MHPATSVILFTVLSGAGFGFLAFLGLGLTQPTGRAALFAYGLAYALAVSGLVASTFHLGNPQRAWRAFSQWRTSWLSREGWASVAALAASAPVALSAAFDPPERALAGGALGIAAGALCLVTILCTAMIYAQLRTVPRWHHWTTPALFFAFAGAGGAILGPGGLPAAGTCLLLGAVMIAAFHLGDGRFATAGASLAAATGLKGGIRPFAPPHTGPNYVTKEMIHIVGRKHARKLRALALILAALAPALILIALPPGLPATLPAFALHLTGAFIQRWLFFAEAEHVVSHYYGRPDLG